MTEYCERCVIKFEMARNPGKPLYMVLPPHHPRCPTIAAVRPKPLLPRGDRVPNPGGETARALGCLCPILDNGFGDPARREFGSWVTVEGCPVH